MDDSNFRTHRACPQQTYNTSELDMHPLMCVQVRRGQMFMDSNLHILHRHVHISFVFKFALGGSHHVNCPFGAGESKGGQLFYYCARTVCVFTFSPSGRSVQILRRGRCIWLQDARACFCTSPLLLQRSSQHSCVFWRRECALPWERSTLSPW